MEAATIKGLRCPSMSTSSTGMDSMRFFNSVVSTDKSFPDDMMSTTSRSTYGR